MPSLPLHSGAAAALGGALGGPGPSLSLLGGPPGIGRTSLLRSLLAAPLPGAPRLIRHLCLPLPGPDQRAGLAESVVREGLEPVPGRKDLGDWEALFGSLVDRVEAERFPLVVALDDVHHLLEGDQEAGRALEEMWARLRAKALPVHVVLSGRSPHFGEALRRRAPELVDGATLDLTLEAADLREVARALAPWPPEERVRGWAVFGGMPDRLRRIDPSTSLATNVRRLVLEPGSPLLGGGLRVLAEELQSPARYASLLRGLAGGARDWGDLRRACPDFENGSQMAPYVARLEALGLVEVRRSLDAGERTRNRRYEIPDPFLAFWYRIILPLLGDIELRGPRELWSAAVRPDLDAHVAAVLPGACRRWMLSHGDEVLPDRVRIAGSLWGGEYDLSVAGTLRNGAPFYGTCVWSDSPAPARALRDIHLQLRSTRYGFGREARHRVLFSAGGFTPEARRIVARDPLAHGVDLHTLLGG